VTGGRQSSVLSGRFFRSSVFGDSWGVRHWKVVELLAGLAGNAGLLQCREVRGSRIWGLSGEVCVCVNVCVNACMCIDAIESLRDTGNSFIN